MRRKLLLTLIFFAITIPAVKTSVPPQYANCSQVLKFDPAGIIQGTSPLDLMGVKGISYSIGYSVIDKIQQTQAQEPANQMCKVQMISIINRYGKTITPSVEGAQASVRATNFNDKTIQSCLGFGLCANIWDAADKDVYPISTLTYAVIRTVIPDSSCGRMRIVYDYLTWILTDPTANSVVTAQSFGTMPKKVAQLAISSVLNVVQCQSADPNGSPRLLMNEPIPSHALTIYGGGSSLQANVQAALLQTYSGAGVSKILYDGTLGSGGGQCLLTTGTATSACFYNTTIKRHVYCLQFAKDPVSGAQICVQTGPFKFGLDFAGSDSIITTASLTVADQGQRMIPVFAAAVSLMHSLPIPNMVFSREVANAVFIGQIIKWSDPRIQATNPSETLPDVQIIRLVRSDSSGTTQVLDRALASFANTNFMWGVNNYWNFHPLGGSSLPTWPGANYSNYDPSMECIVTHCSRSICTPGTYLNPKLDVCVKCPVGTYEDTSGQSLQCIPCPKGYYSDTPGSPLCNKCTENGYQDEEGQTSCKVCPANTRRFFLQETIVASNNQTVTVSVDSSAATIDDCKCIPGFWLPSSLRNDSSPVASQERREGKAEADLSLGYTTATGGEACVTCPQGATCPGFQNNLQTIPRTMDGYWGRPDHPVLFYECEDATSCYADYRCGAGHEGQMCKEEEPGYFSIGEKWYLQCPANSGSAAALTVFLTALVIFIWLQIMRIAENTIYDSFDVGIKFLHLIGFIAQFPLRWHPNLDYIFLVLLVANLEINFISPHCIWPTFTGATAFYFQLFVPFVIVGIATMYWYITHKYFAPRKVILAQAEVEPLLNRKCLRDGSVSMPNWQTYAISKSLQVFGFMYQVLVFKNFSCFLCRPDPDGKTSFLYTAPDIECGSGVHISMMVMAVFYGIFVIVGFPASMFYLLMKAKRENLLVRNDYIMKYGTFYQPWKVEYVWWEVVVLARKFCIGMILAVCAVPMIQGALAMILIYVSIMIHLSAAPYAEDWNNTLEIVCLFCALAYTACGMIFYPSLDQNINCVGTSGDAAADSLCQSNMQIKELASFLLILVVIVAFLLTTSSTCFEMYERYLSRKTSKFIQMSQKWFGLKDRSDKNRLSRPSMSGAAIAALMPLFGRTASADSTISDDPSATPRSGRHFSFFGAKSLGSPITVGIKSLGGNSTPLNDRNKVYPEVVSIRSTGTDTDSVQSVRPRMARRLSREESMDDNNPTKMLNAIQLRLSDMLDGYYMTSWKDMLKEMEKTDHDIMQKFSEENEASTLLDQERRYLEMDAYLPRFSCHLNHSLDNMSNSNVSAFLRTMLRLFPAFIDYMATASEEARTGFAVFVKDFITFCEDRPQFFDGSGRDSVIAFEYRSIVADWLIKNDQKNVEVCRAMLDDICLAAGLKMTGHSNTKRESVFEAMNRIRSERSFSKLTKQGTVKETAMQALMRVGTQRGLLIAAPKPAAMYAKEGDVEQGTKRMAGVVPGEGKPLLNTSNSDIEELTDRSVNNKERKLSEALLSEELLTARGVGETRLDVNHVSEPAVVPAAGETAPAELEPVAAAATPRESLDIENAVQPFR